MKLKILAEDHKPPAKSYHDKSLPKQDVQPIIDQKLWSHIQKITAHRKSNKYPQVIGTIDDADVFLVDGDKIRREHFLDFSYGGHDLVYGNGPHSRCPGEGFIPLGQIWLDGEVNSRGLTTALYHEVIERRLMSKGLDYDHAHEIANLSEREMSVSRDKI